jgi:hypothetical protein
MILTTLQPFLDKRDTNLLLWSVHAAWISWTAILFHSMYNAEEQVQKSPSVSGPMGFIIMTPGLFYITRLTVVQERLGVDGLNILEIGWTCVPLILLGMDCMFTCMRQDFTRANAMKLVWCFGCCSFIMLTVGRALDVSAFLWCASIPVDLVGLMTMKVIHGFSSTSVSTVPVRISEQSDGRLPETAASVDQPALATPNRALAFYKAVHSSETIALTAPVHDRPRFHISTMALPTKLGRLSADATSSFYL